MTKLLDFVKEKGLSHADAMKLIEKHFVKPDDDTEITDEPDTSDEQIDKPDPDTDTSDKPEDDIDAKTKALVNKLADEEEAKIKKEAELEKAKVVELVQAELKKRGKITRRTPSKGKIVKTPSLDYEINVRGYEVKTIRKKKD